MRTVEKRIGEIMRERGMTQAETAREVGMSPKLFNSVLKGRKLLRVEHIRAICRVLACTPNDLFGYENHPIAVVNEAGEAVAVIAGNKVIEREGYMVVLSEII